MSRALTLLITLLVVSTVMANPPFPDAATLPARPELPDPLVMLDGQRITTPEQWTSKRRPELKELFQHYMYGYGPPAPEQITASVTREDRQLFGGKATLKEVAITFGPPECPKLPLLLVVPNQRTKPAPVFLGLNFCGNHTALKDPNVTLPTTWVPDSCAGSKDHHATDASRGSQVDVWAIEDTIDHGYAVALCYCGDIDPDRADAREGIQRFFLKKGQTRPASDDWATIAAWAWGLQRAVDHLLTDKDIDKNRIAVVGHSRLGKTALLAGALDERIALVIPHQAGCGGTAPSRGKIGESVQRINTSFPHWFDAEFKKFNEHPERLPFDQHCLVALVAPRPVLLSNAVEDTWANPEGQFQVLQAADPVYRLLGVEGLSAKQMPETGKLVDSRLGYYIRPGKHSMTREDWQIFRAFADKHLGKP
jgi:hypothetical protein